MTRLGTRLLLLTASTLYPTPASATDLPWLEYHGAPGCPTREVLEQELLNRSSQPRTHRPGQLAIDIVLEDGSFVGIVRSGNSEAVASRAVRHESCEQVVHALALIAALMLDGEPQAESAAPLEPAAQTPQSPPPVSTESVVVTTPPPTKPPETPPKRRAIGAVTLGPWFSPTLEGLATPSMQLGARAGVLLTLHRLLPRSQQLLRLSLAQVRSGTITVSDHRTANITWTSLRLDLCHGSSSGRLTSVGACAWFDVGRWQGEGWVDGSRRENGTIWPRLGGAAQLRLGLVGGLALCADLGLMVALSRPEFYFAASTTEARQSIHRPSRVGPIADLGLELHFW